MNRRPRGVSYFVGVLRVSQDILISIIDDQESVREAIRALVQSYGYKVATFSSAELFLRSEVMSETKCLIADVKLPRLSGLELQRIEGARAPDPGYLGYSVSAR
jgi:FixJ family two-component response regulator